MIGQLQQMPPPQNFNMPYGAQKQAIDDMIYKRLLLQMQTPSQAP